MRLGRPAPTTTINPCRIGGKRATTTMAPTPTPAAAAPTAPTAAPAHTLVSFDVDGTLIRGKAGDRKANALHKQSFTAAFQRCFGIDTHIDVCRHDGGTDPLILVKVLVEVHNLDAAEVLAKLPEMQQAMLDHYFAASERWESEGGGGGEDGSAGASDAVPFARPGDGLELLPGAKETLEALAALGPSVAASCLVTGNLQPIGWAKMRALGIEDLFTGPPRFGGFGSDHCSGNVREMWRDRAEFVRVARRRAEEAFEGDAGAGGAAAIARHWHVGDTPADVRAALAAGAGAVAVATGAFSAEELRRAADEALEELKKEVDDDADGALASLPPVVVLEQGLRDVEAVLAAMGLPAPQSKEER